MKTILMKIILVICIISTFLTGLSYSAETMDVANAKQKYLAEFQNVKKLALTNNWYQNYSEFSKAFWAYVLLSRSMNKTQDVESVCYTTKEFFEKQLVFFKKVNSPDCIYRCESMIEGITNHLMLFYTLSVRKISNALKVYQAYIRQYGNANKTINITYRMILFDIAVTAFIKGDYIKAKNFFTRYLSLGTYLHDMHRIIIQIFNERMNLGNVTPEYTQKIALVVFRYTKDPDTGTYREITRQDLKRVMSSEVGILKRFVEVFSGGKLSIEITPYYLDRVEKTYCALNKRELTRPDFTAINPPLSDSIIKALDASDVIIGYFSISHVTNSYGDSFYFPAIPDRLTLGRKGIVLINYGPPGYWYPSFHGLITHEWFHTVERLFPIPIRQDVHLSLDIYNMPERFPGLINKYNDKNFDAWWWAFSKIIPEHIKKWKQNGNHIGWKQFSYSSVFPYSIIITDELLQRRRKLSYVHDNNIPETNWKGEYQYHHLYFHPWIKKTPIIIRDEGTGKISYEERISSSGVSPPNDFDGVKWSRTIHVTEDQYQVNFKVKRGSINIFLSNKLIYSRGFGNHHDGLLLNRRGENKLRIEYTGDKTDNNGITIELIKCRRVKIKNADNGLYLKEKNGRMVSGDGNGKEYFWYLEILPVNNQLVRIRNLLTNHYIHKERNIAYIQLSAISSAAWSSHWWLTLVGQNRFEFKNRWDSNGVLHIPDNADQVSYAFLQGRKHYCRWILEDY